MTVAIYTRLSDNNEKSNSIENQISVIEKYLSKQKDFYDAEIIQFSDFGCTGLNTDRPSFQELLTYVRARKVNVIVVKDLSRLGRNYLDVCKLTQSIFPFMGVRVISVSEGYDSANADDSFFATDLAVTFKSIIDEFHSTETSDKIRKVFLSRLKKGEFLGHLLPFGYVYSDDKKPVIDIKKAEIVRRMFKLRIDGLSNAKIAGVINAMNTYTECGNLWCGSVVRNLLRNTAYIGVKTSHKQITVLKAKRRKAYPNELIVFKNAYPPIIDKETFEKSEETFTKKGKPFVPEKNIFSRKLYCEKCERTLRRSEKWLSCSNTFITGGEKCFDGKISVERLKSVVLDTVKAHIGDELLKHKKLFSFSDRKKLENQISILKEKKGSIFESYAEGKISEEDFILQKSAVTTEIQRLKNELDRANELMAWHSKDGHKENPLQIIKRLYNSSELTREHMMFVSKILVTDTNNYRILLEKDEILMVLCRNIQIYEEN